MTDRILFGVHAALALFFGWILADIWRAAKSIARSLETIAQRPVVNIDHAVLQIESAKLSHLDHAKLAAAVADAAKRQRATGLT